MWTDVHRRTAERKGLRYPSDLSEAEWRLEIVKRNDIPRFEVLPKRWIVERTLAWISHCRRLARDFERHVRTVVAFVYLAMIRLMLRRLTASRSA